MTVWANIAIVVLTWLACAAFTWGVMTERLKYLAQRVDKLEDEKFITRAEYESRHKELIDEVRGRRKAGE